MLLRRKYYPFHISTNLYLFHEKHAALSTVTFVYQSGTITLHKPADTLYTFLYIIVLK